MFNSRNYSAYRLMVVTTESDTNSSMAQFSILVSLCLCGYYSRAIVLNGYQFSMVIRRDEHLRFCLSSRMRIENWELSIDQTPKGMPAEYAESLQNFCEENG